MKDNILIIAQIFFQKTAGQGRFKRELIDKWISDESLERVSEDINSQRKRQGKMMKILERLKNGSINHI